MPQMPIPLPPDMGMGAPGAMPPPGPVAPPTFNPNDLVAAPPAAAAPKKKSGKSKAKKKGKY